MLIFILIIIAFIVGFIIRKAGEKSFGITEEIGSATIYLASIALAISLVVLIIFKAEAPKDKIELEVKYNILSKQTGICSIQDYNIYQQIIEYNQKVESGKYFNNSLWTNWFTPSFYNDLKTIDVENMNCK